jgi:hypothetical protein
MPLKYATIGIVYNYMLPVQDMTNENIMVPKHLRSTPVFNVLIVYFRFICSNNPATPAYGVYISQYIVCHSTIVRLDCRTVTQKNSNGTGFFYMLPKQQRGVRSGK